MSISSEAEARGRVGVRRKLQDTERERAIRRCRSAYMDLSITRKAWERSYPADIREDALDSMSPAELGVRG